MFGKLFKSKTVQPPEEPGYKIVLEYPPAVKNEPRWGYGLPAHPKLEAALAGNEENYLEALKAFDSYAAKYNKIPINEVSPIEPYLDNRSFRGMDSFALYCLLSIYNPRKFIEVGSGNSTKFARQAIKDNNLRTEIISIDPHPHFDIDSICDKVIREPLESVDLKIFSELREKDFVFIDNSHRSFMNSDVTTAFLDIIPRLKGNVIVHLHDIFLPYDYPPDWAFKYYNEQYLLASYILAEACKSPGAVSGPVIDPLLPIYFICRAAAYRADLTKLRIIAHGASFWFTKREY